MLQISEEKRGHALILCLKGRLDPATAQSALDRLASCVDRDEHRLALDCSALDYVSSAGLRVVLMISKRVTKLEGRLVLFGLSQPTRRIFDLVGFTSILGIYDSAEAAIEALLA